MRIYIMESSTNWESSNLIGVRFSLDEAKASLEALWLAEKAADEFEENPTILPDWNCTEFTLEAPIIECYRLQRNNDQRFVITVVDEPCPELDNATDALSHSEELAESFQNEVKRLQQIIADLRDLLDTIILESERHPILTAKGVKPGETFGKYWRID